MNFTAQNLLLYAVTDRAWVGRQTLLEQIESALKGGATLVQLREKDLPRLDYIREAAQATALCHRYGVPLIVNDSLEVALKSGADGVHVGIEDQPVAEIRRQAGKGFLIGATAKTVEQARAAQAAGADYLGVGAVFPSPTKKNAIRITTGQLREICASVSIPCVAIGGISRENLPALAGGGMDGFALVSAIFSPVSYTHLPDDRRLGTAGRRSVFLISSKRVPGAARGSGIFSPFRHPFGLLQAKFSERDGFYAKERCSKFPGPQARQPQNLGYDCHFGGGGHRADVPQLQPARHPQLCQAVLLRASRPDCGPVSYTHLALSSLRLRRRGGWKLWLAHILHVGENEI